MSGAQASLDSWPEAFEAPDDDEKRQHFRLLNDRMAVWALRKLRQAEARQAENKAVYEAEQARLDAWATEVDRPLELDHAFFQALLEEYGLGERAKDEKRKTIKLPGGVISTTLAGGGWTVVDPLALGKWALRNFPELVDVTPKFLVAAAKKLAQAEDGPKKDLPFIVSDGKVVVAGSGDVVPGVEVAPKVLKATAKADPPEPA